jgi:hypothetical protein
VEHPLEVDVRIVERDARCLSITAARSRTESCSRGRAGAAGRPSRPPMYEQLLIDLERIGWLFRHRPALRHPAASPDFDAVLALVDEAFPHWVDHEISSDHHRRWP